MSNASRIKGWDDLWSIEVKPLGHGPVTLMLEGERDCDDDGAACTKDDRGLAESVSLTILGPPALSVADEMATEGEESSLAFPVTLDRTATEEVTVDYATSDGTATAGSDYTTTSGMLTFAEGETTQIVTVPVLDNEDVEEDETLTVNLSDASGARIEGGSATGTIGDNDTE